MIKILGLCWLPLLGGCTILGFLFSPSASEQKIAPQFPLAEHKDERLYLIVRSSQAAGVDADVPELVARAIAKDLCRNVKLKPEFIINPLESNQYTSTEYFSWTQVEEEARRADASMLLYVEVIEYELVPMHQQKYYMGQLTTRSVLLDAKTSEGLWPVERTGRIVRTRVDFEKKGRSEILWRLATATSHCVVREFYYCPKPTYSISEEIKSWDLLMEDLD